jgi:hypothetical protein
MPEQFSRPAQVVLCQAWMLQVEHWLNHKNPPAAQSHGSNCLIMVCVIDNRNPKKFRKKS